MGEGRVRVRGSRTAVGAAVVVHQHCTSSALGSVHTRLETEARLCRVTSGDTRVEIEAERRRGSGWGRWAGEWRVARDRVILRVSSKGKQLGQFLCFGVQTPKLKPGKMCEAI